MMNYIHTSASSFLRLKLLLIYFRKFLASSYKQYHHLLRISHDAPITQHSNFHTRISVRDRQ